MGLTQKLGTIPLAIQTDSSNNVGIGGAANASYKLAVTGASLFSGAATFSSSVTASGNLNLQGAATRNINFYDSSNTNINAQIQYDQLTSNTGQLFFGTNNAGTFATRMTITSSGNVGIGTSNPLQTNTNRTVTTINGTNDAILNLATGGTLRGYIYVDSSSYTELYSVGQLALLSNASQPMTFATNGSERMRITSGGNVEIANGYLSTSAGSGTSYCGKLSTVYTYPYIDTYLDSIAGASYQSRLRFRLNTAAGSMEDKLILWYNGSVTFSGLAGSGTRTVTALSDGTLSTSSDSRLKQEDKEYTIAGLKELLQITPKAYKWLSDIEQRGEDAQTELGFFADEVAPIIPSAAPKGQDDMYGFYDRALMAVMVKSIQELSAKVTALENK